MAAPKQAKQEIELVPDAWERFRSAVHTMAKAGPQHRKTATKPKAKTGESQGRRAKR
jgi:hypothetical protein